MLNSSFFNFINVSKVNFANQIFPNVWHNIHIMCNQIFVLMYYTFKTKLTDKITTSFTYYQTKIVAVPYFFTFIFLREIYFVFLIPAVSLKYSHSLYLNNSPCGRWESLWKHTFILILTVGMIDANKWWFCDSKIR